MVGYSPSTSTHLNHFTFFFTFNFNSNFTLSYLNFNEAFEGPRPQVPTAGQVSDHLLASPREPNPPHIRHVHVPLAVATAHLIE
jgi:hypothetical protein